MCSETCWRSWRVSSVRLRLLAVLRRRVWRAADVDGSQRVWRIRESLDALVGGSVVVLVWDGGLSQLGRDARKTAFEG